MNGVCIGLAAALLALFSDAAMRAAADAAGVFASGVMPALFPMMVLNALGDARKPERLWQTVAFAFLSGTPASAQRVAGRYAADDARLPALLAATGVMSPLFFTGTLAGWTGDARAARIMLLSHWAGALAAAACARWAGRRKGRARPVEKARRAVFAAVAAIPRSLRARPGMAARKPCRARLPKPAYTPPVSDCIGRASATPPAQPVPPPAPLLRALPAALASSAQALLAVCAAMMLFAILAALLRAALACLWPALVERAGAVLAVCHAALEIGGGCAEMASAGLPAPALCALCGFGGLSLWMQSLLFVGDRIGPARLLALRALHGALSYGVCALLLALVG